ncbi:MAG TPA: hypothetical protein VF884_04215 [Nitrososphaeraceae archaeon]
MKKQFIVSKIEATQDGSPYVYIGFTDPADNKSGEAKQLNPFSPKTMGFSSPEDLMKNLPKAMGNIAGMMGGAGGLIDSPTIKLSMREYEEMGLKVGDKVSIEITKKQDSGI